MPRPPARLLCAVPVRATLFFSLAALLLLTPGCATSAGDGIVEAPLVTGHEYFNRGEALRARGKLDAAIAAYDAAIAQDSSFVAAYCARGDAKKKKGDLRGALTDYDRAAFYNPSHLGAVFNRANIRRELGDLDGALADYDAALHLQPSFADALVARAVIELDRGQLDAAVQDLKRALQFEPKHPAALASLEKARRAGANLDQPLPPEPPPKIYELALLTEPPHPLLRPPPEYPVRLRAKGITGKVLIEFIVTSSGDVVDAHAVRATHPGFIPVAVATISRWKFYPGRVKGRPVNTRMQQPISFDLEDNVPPKK